MGLTLEQVVAYVRCEWRRAVRVLVVVGVWLLGSVGMARASGLDPSFTALPASGSSELQSAREAAVAGSLSAGKVLIAGGLDGSSFLPSAELFDPSADTFSALAASGSSELQTARAGAVAASLPGAFHEHFHRFAGVWQQ